MVNQAKKDFAGKIEVVDINIDSQRNVELAKKYRINVIPTYVFLDSSGGEIDRTVGALTKDNLYSRLKSLEDR